MLIVVVFTVLIYLFITKTTGHITKLWFHPQIRLGYSRLGGNYHNKNNKQQKITVTTCMYIMCNKTSKHSVEE